MTASLTCRKLRSLESGAVYAWEMAEGETGNVLIYSNGFIARPCSAEGTLIGAMLLDRRIGNLEHPDPDPKLRRNFLIVASAIFQESERQGEMPDTVARTYW